jgi:hypothetical protein
MEKTTIYGLPLNPKSLLKQLKGASFCVSYATRDKLGSQLEDAIELVGQDGILMIDNGAFSMHQKGISAMNDDYIEDFADWANDILARCPQAWVVCPDVIGGTVDENSQLFNEFGMMIEDSDRMMPVWHMHEPLSYLTYLCESAEYIAIGSSGDYWQVGTEKWHARIKEAFAAIDAWEIEGEGAYVRPRIHMMRAQSMAHLYPFDSSDSTNVAMNHGRYRAQGEGHVERFAKRVDGKIQASAGPAADHQIKRPLLDHIDTANLKTIWFLEAAGYQVRKPLVLEPTAEEWLEQYNRAAA